MINKLACLWATTTLFGCTPQLRTDYTAAEQVRRCRVRWRAARVKALARVRGCPEVPISHRESAFMGHVPCPGWYEMRDLDSPASTLTADQRAACAGYAVVDECSVSCSTLCSSWQPFAVDGAQSYWRRRCYRRCAVFAMQTRYTVERSCGDAEYVNRLRQLAYSKQMLFGCTQLLYDAVQETEY